MDNAGRRNIHAQAACHEADPGTMCRHVEDRPPIGIWDAATCSAGNFPHSVRNSPNSHTTHPRFRPHSTDARPECMALPRIARPQLGGESGRICAEIRRIVRSREPSASGSRRDGKGPHPPHRPLPRDRAAAEDAGRPRAHRPSAPHRFPRDRAQAPDRRQPPGSATASRRAERPALRRTQHR